MCVWELCQTCLCGATKYKSWERKTKQTLFSWVTAPRPSLRCDRSDWSPLTTGGSLFGFYLIIQPGAKRCTTIILILLFAPFKLTLKTHFSCRIWRDTTRVTCRSGWAEGKKELNRGKTWKVTEQSFHLRNLRQTTQSFYSPLSQVVTVWGFLLVRGVTLHTGYCPVVSHSVLQLSDFSPKPPWRKVKASFQASAGFTAALCSSLIAAFFIPWI